MSSLGFGKWKRGCQVLVLGSGKGREWDGLSRGRGERKMKTFLEEVILELEEAKKIREKKRGKF